VTSGHAEYPESLWSLETTLAADKCATNRLVKQSGIRDCSEEEISVDQDSFEPYTSADCRYASADGLISFDISCGMNNAEEETRQFLLRGSDNHDSDLAVDAASEFNGDLYSGGRKCLSHRYNSWSADSTDGSYRVTVENQNDINYDRNYYHNDAAAQHGNNSDNFDDSSNKILTEGGIANQSSLCLSDALLDILNSLRGGTHHSAATQAPMPSAAAEENHCSYGYREDSKQISEKAMTPNSGVNVHVVDVRFLDARGTEEHSSILAFKTSNSAPCNHGEYPMKLPQSLSHPQSNSSLKHLQTEHRDSRLRRKYKDEGVLRNGNQAEDCSPERLTPGDRRSADNTISSLNVSKFLLKEASNGTSPHCRRGSGRWSVGSALEAAECCVYSNSNSGGSGDLHFTRPIRGIRFHGGQSISVQRENTALRVHDVKSKSKPSEKTNGARCLSQHREEIGGNCQEQTETERNIEIRKTKYKITEIKIENDGITDICDVLRTDDSSIEEGEKGERGGDGGSRGESCLGRVSDCRVDRRLSCSNSELGEGKINCQTNGYEFGNFQETIIEGFKVGDISLDHSSDDSIRLNMAQISHVRSCRNGIENDAVEESETSWDSPPVTHCRDRDRSLFSNRADGPLSSPFSAVNMLFDLDLATRSLPLPLPLFVPQVQDPLPPLTTRYFHPSSWACIVSVSLLEH
jgi:hypothetical protein